MRAVVCPELGPPSVLRIEERPEPALRPGHARIAVRAAGVNFPDLLMVAGGYQFKPPLPFVPGMEGAGEVIEVADDLAGFKAGDRVLVKMRPGTFQDQVMLPPDQLRPLPAPFDFAAGAAFAVAYVTAWHALFQRARLKAGEVLLVHGATGGVGLAAVDLGARAGARVIATGGGDAKLEVVARYGAETVLNYEAGPFREQVKELTDGRGADVIYDPVGGDVFDQSLRCIAWGGRILIIGFTSGRIAMAPANYPLLKGCSVIGVRAGEWGRRDPAARDEMNAAVHALAEAGELRPHISHRLPLEQAAAAMEVIRNRQVVGKVVLDLAAG